MARRSTVRTTAGVGTAATGTARRVRHPHTGPPRKEDEMADKSPRQHQSKKSGKTLKEKRSEKKAKQDPKRAV